MSTDDTYDRPHIRRKKTPQDWITAVGGIIAIVGSLSVFVGWVLDLLPFERSQAHRMDFEALGVKIAQNTTNIQSTQSIMEILQRNSLLTLELQLQARIESISTTLATMNPSEQAYRTLVDTKATAQQQLDEVKRQLNRR